MIAVTIVALVVGLRYWKKNKKLRIITIYTGTALLVDLVSSFLEIYSENQVFKVYAESLCLYLYVVVEITTFFAYINSNILVRRIRFIIGFLLSAFFILFFYIGQNRYFQSYDQSNWISAIESFFIVGPCLFYFYQLFNLKLIDVKNHSSFWIVTGILFYHSCSIPIFLIAKYMERNISEHYSNVILSLNFILYIMLFLLFIKGYLCKNEVI